MAISTSPTGAGQYTWEYTETFRRQAFLDEIGDEIDDTTVILGSIAIGLAWDYVKAVIIGTFSGYATAIVTGATIMNALTSAKRKQMMQEIYDQFTDEDNSYTKCKVRLKFKSHQQGSQGWFWLPTSTYQLSYS